MVRTGAINPVEMLTNIEPPNHASEAYEKFDQREAGWVKVRLEPAA
ncbi:MAG: hypothetical protein WB696_19495 [Chthoniobacterales bacterium]|jgi:threonine dehydrogenase-like Zn-dependent dehydrogenase